LKFYISILLISFYNLFNIGDHETYLSITELIIHENGNLEISIETTAHDFEYVYKKELNKTLKSTIIFGEEYYENEDLRNYLLNHFSIENENNKIDLKIIGNEVELDGRLLIYLEGKSKKKSKYFKIKNDLLVSVLPNQQNIVNLSGTIKSSYTFNKNIRTYVFQ
jgi:hypothetical protein